MKVHVFYTGWVAPDHKSFTTGGVQTYLLNLSKVFKEEGYDEFHYYRGSDVNNDVVIEGVYVHELKTRLGHGVIKRVFNHYKGLIDKKDDIVLFADDFLSTKATDYNSISIQHGIFWDIPNNKPGNMSFLMSFLKKSINAWRRMLHIKNVKLLVCVDYNFQNWFKATFPYTIVKTRVIPNFTKIMEPVEKPNEVVNIIFARRFERFRGTRVFGKAIKRVINEYKNVNITIAGWGDDANWLHQEFDSFSQVTFTEYKSSDSLIIHGDKHIAIVPTIGSEGTSLSLLEAMSAQCAVISSDVGGITNIVINGFNGLMIPAGDEDGLYNAIKYLIDNPQERERLSLNAYNVVKASFSYDKWKNSWKEVIRQIKTL